MGVYIENAYIQSLYIICTEEQIEISFLIISNVFDKPTIQLTTFESDLI